MNKKIKGIAASDGLALASALVIKEDKLNVPKKANQSAEVELALFNKATVDSLQELRKLEKITIKKLGEEKGAIFAAHQDIVNDPELQAQIKHLITEKNESAAHAIQSVTNNFADMFGAMEDPYFKERATDVRDIGNRLTKHVLGVPIVDLSTIDKEVIIVAHDLTPSQTAQLDRRFVKGFVTNIGGRTSHSAIMARSLEIPAVLGLKNVTELIKNGDEIILNGRDGYIQLELDHQQKAEFQEAIADYELSKKELEQYRHKTTKTHDGRKLLVEANIGSPNDVEAVLERGADGIGLFRSEFLYMDNDHFPTEDEQFHAYKKVAQAMDGKEVVIRTLDIGGDKKLSYFQFPEELNPFLGYRAIRFTLDNKKIFDAQIKALLRASAFGKISIMFPMIATIDEFRRAKKRVEKAKRELDEKKIAYDKNIKVGIMVEIPAAAILANDFSREADFLSIGTNDLIQYSMAADRMSENVSYLYQPLNPALLRLIKITIDGGHGHDRWVGMCGEMAGDPMAIPLLIGLGLDAFSMSATSILRARALMAKIDYQEAKVLAETALTLSTASEVEALTTKFLEQHLHHSN